MDRLAAGGLRYTNFHTTAMCSPTRASLMTGRNHHAAGLGIVTEFATGFPGYAGRLTKRAATLAEMLRAARLQHVRGRQVAPDAAARGDRRRPVRRLAAPARLRPLVRLPGRLHRPVVPGAVRRQPDRRHAAAAGLPPLRGPGRPRHRVRARSAGRRRRASRSSCTSRSGRRTGRTRRPPTYIEKYRGRYDAGLGRGARRVAGAAEGDGDRAGRHRAAAAQRRTCRPGTS